MKNCIGIIFDLSSRTKHQFSNIDAGISGDVIGSFLPFLELLSSSIDDQFDIFIGAEGVDYRYGRICDILLLLKCLSSCENLPIIEPSVNGRNNSKRIFIKKLQEA